MKLNELFKIIILNSTMAKIKFDEVYNLDHFKNDYERTKSNILDFIENDNDIEVIDEADIRNLIEQNNNASALAFMHTVHILNKYWYMTPVSGASTFKSFERGGKILLLFTKYLNMADPKLNKINFNNILLDFNNFSFKDYIKDYDNINSDNIQNIIVNLAVKELRDIATQDMDATDPSLSVLVASANINLRYFNILIAFKTRLSSDNLGN